MPLPVQNKGIASRDFIYVHDICRGLAACAFQGRPNEVYNLATGKEVTISELASTINNVTGNRAEIVYLPKRAWDSSGNRFGSPEKAKRDRGFEAQIDLKEG